jgi:hypothetical protein
MASIDLDTGGGRQGLVELVRVHIIYHFKNCEFAKKETRASLVLLRSSDTNQPHYHQQLLTNALANGIGQKAPGYHKTVMPTVP